MNIRINVRVVLLHAVSLLLGAFFALVLGLTVLVTLTVGHRLFGHAGWLPDDFDMGFFFGLAMFPGFRGAEWLLGLRQQG